MSFVPCLGLISHLFATPRPYLDLLMAAAIALATLAYMTRIAGISFVYGLARRRDDEDTADQS